MKEKEKKNLSLEDEYTTNLLLSLGIALALFIAIFAGIKKVEVSPYKPKSEVTTIVEEINTQVEELKEPPPPPKPKLPVEIKETNEVSDEEENQQEEQEIDFSPTTTFNELEAPPPPKVEKTYEFFAVEVKPKVVKQVEPQYPELARKAGIEGRVFVKVLVNEQGKVDSVVVLKSTNPIFIKPAIAAAKQFVFTPGRQRDKAVKVWVAIPFIFKFEQ